MYTIIPRKKEWLIPLLKHFDVISISEKEVKTWWDCEIIEVLGFESPIETGTFNLDNSIRLEGLCTWEEVEELRNQTCLFIESVKHAYILQREGFFGDLGFAEYEMDADCYYVVCHLCEERKEEFIEKEFVKYLPEIRIRELYKK